MKVLRWILAFVLYYVIVHFGVNIYISLFDKMYIEPRWLYYVILLVITSIAVNIVFWISFFIARLIIYGLEQKGKDHTYLITLPWLAWNLFFLLASTWNKLFDGMPWIIYLGILFNSGCWIFMLGLGILFCLSNNKNS
jgi:hypothetical protein